MPVSVTPTNGVYAGQAIRIIPAPLVSVQKSYTKDGTGKPLGADFTITINGTLLATKGNPLPDGTFSTAAWTGTATDPNDDPVSDIPTDRLGALLRKQQALRDIFSREGFLFQVEVFSAEAPLECRPSVESINFEEGIYWDRTDYSITLKTHQINNLTTSGFQNAGTNEDDFTWRISAATEQWNINESDSKHLIFSSDGSSLHGIMKMFEITHSLSANGQRLYESTSDLSLEPWQQASGYVLTNIQDKTKTQLDSFGLGMGDISEPLQKSINNYIGTTGVIDHLNDNYIVANHQRSQSVNMSDGSFSVDENYLVVPSALFDLTNGFPATEECDVSLEENDESPNINLTINGTIKGLNTGSVNNGSFMDAWTNASGYFATTVESNIRNRLNTINGSLPNNLSVNNSPLTRSVSRNPNTAEISYNYSFDTRPSNLTKAITESIKTSDILQGQNFSETPVIGGTIGPVIQYLNSNTSNQRTLEISLVVSGVNLDSDEFSAMTLEEKLRTAIVNKRPSNDPVYSSDLTAIYNAANPSLSNEAVAGQVFYTQPNESWDYTTGQYNYSITWTYIRNSAFSV